MSEIHSVTIAGVRVVANEVALPSWLRRWSSTGRAGDLRLNVRGGRPLAAPGPSEAFGDGVDRLEVSFLMGRHHLVTRDLVGHVIRSACFDARTGEVDVVLDPRAGGAPFDRGLLEWLVLNRLGWRRGFVLSACGIVREGRALVFAGGPGSGRTTIAELLQRNAGTRILSDDAVALYESRRQGFVATAWPWPEDGAFRNRGAGALKACHRIRRAPIVLAEPLVGNAARDALGCLVRRPVGDGEACARIETAFERCSVAIPTVRLGFPPDARLARFVGGESTSRRAPAARVPALATP